MKIGRHFRHQRSTKIILGRRAEENDQLARLCDAPAAAHTTLVVPENFLGPTALIVGPADDESLDFAGALIRRYAKAPDDSPPRVRVRQQVAEYLRELGPSAAAAAAQSL